MKNTNKTLVSLRVCKYGPCKGEYFAVIKYGNEIECYCFDDDMHFPFILGYYRISRPMPETEHDKCIKQLQKRGYENIHLVKRLSIKNAIF